MTETSNKQETPQYPPPGYYYPMPQNSDDEIDLRELFSILWKEKWWIIAVIFVFAITSVGISLYLPNTYKAEVILAPMESEQASQMATIANQFGGLASLAGINLGSQSTDKTTLALQVLQSRKFIGEFIAKHHLLVPIMAAKGWNSNDNTLKIDSDSYDIQNKKWIRKVKYPFKPQPSLQEAYKRFSKNILDVEQDTKTGMITVGVSFYSPYMAKQWADWLVTDLNEKIREQDMTTAQNSIKYLRQQLTETSLAENRAMLYQLIEQQTKTLMLTKVRKEYVFKIIDPAVVPEFKDKPKRALIVLLGTLLGGVFSVFLVLIKYFMKKNRD